METRKPAANMTRSAVLRWAVLLGLGILALAAISYPWLHKQPGISSVASLKVVSLERPNSILMTFPSARPYEFLTENSGLSSANKCMWIVSSIQLHSDDVDVNDLYSSERIVHNYPICLTEDGQPLIRDVLKPIGDVAETRRHTTYALYDPKTRSKKDVTPANLLSIQNSISPKAPETWLWDSDNGLVVFAWDYDAKVMKVWAGKNELQEMGNTPEIVARASLYLNDRFTYGAVTQQGDIVVYDTASGSTRIATEYSAIGKALAREIVAFGSQQTDCAVSKDLAMFGDEHTLTLVTADGRKCLIKLKDSLERRPSGWKRLEVESTAISLGLLDERIHNEAKKLPLDFISQKSQYFPLSVNTLGVIDQFYQRLVVISPK